MYKLFFLSAILLISGSEAQLQLWQNFLTDQGGGEKYEFYGSGNLDASWDNRASHVVAKNGNYILYKEPNFEGEALIVLEGEAVPMSSDWNDKLSSVKFLGNGCVKRGIDFAGADIKRIPNVSTMDSCMKYCNEEERCKSVAHDVPNQNCWIKTGERGARVNIKAGVDSASKSCYQKKALPRIEKCVHKDFDFYGADIGSVSAADIPSCVESCQGLENCKSIAFSKGTCWRKDKRLGAIPRPKTDVHSVEMICVESC